MYWPGPHYVGLMQWHKNYIPLNCLCNGQTHELHIKFRQSECNFLTRCGLHEIHTMSWKFHFSRFVFICVCSVFEGQGKAVLLKQCSPSQDLRQRLKGAPKRRSTMSDPSPLLGLLTRLGGATWRYVSNYVLRMRPAFSSAFSNPGVQIPSTSTVKRKPPSSANFLVSQVSRKSAWIDFGFEKVNLERNADKLGREFWGGGGGVWNPGKTRPKTFAIEIRWETRRHFSQNSPDQNKQFIPIWQIRSAEPRDQYIYIYIDSQILADFSDSSRYLPISRPF